MSFSVAGLDLRIASAFAHDIGTQRSVGDVCGYVDGPSLTVERIKILRK